MKSRAAFEMIWSMASSCWRMLGGMEVFGSSVGNQNLSQMTGRLMELTFGARPSRRRMVWRWRSSLFMIIAAALSFQRRVEAALTPLIPSLVGFEAMVCCLDLFCFLFVTRTNGISSSSSVSSSSSSSGAGKESIQTVPQVAHSPKIVGMEVSY